MAVRQLLTVKSSTRPTPLVDTAARFEVAQSGPVTCLRNSDDVGLGHFAETGIAVGLYCSYCRTGGNLTNRRLVGLKIIAGLLLLAAMGAYLVPRASQLIEPDAVVDNGARGLVVIATQGGNPDLDLFVKQFYSDEDEIRLVLYFQADGVVYGEQGNLQQIDLVVDFVGDAFRDVEITCGADVEVPTLKWADVRPGPRKAIDVDFNATSNSAINYGSPKDGERQVEVVPNQVVREFSGKIWPLKPGSHYESGQRSNKGDVWAEECRISDTAAWRYRRSDSGLSQVEKKTLLPFQVNWTSISENTDVQRNMKSLVVVERSEGVVLSEGYPQPSAGNDDWFYWNNVSWVGQRSEIGHLAYTDQPVYILTDRAESDRKAILMLWAGVLLGIAATIVVRIGSLAAELIFGSQQLRHENPGV